MILQTFYRNGLSAGIVPRNPNRPHGRRDTVQGWSARSTRSNRVFLQSVDERQLGGLGLALTLTVRDCPPSPQDWNRTRLAFVHRLRRLGLVRLHWLTEWQSRAVPHFHMAAFFDPAGAAADVGRLVESVTAAWLAVSQAFGSARQSQVVKPITDAVGWFQYQSKHASRGLSHYQRSPEKIPPRWRSRTGRVWGYVGEWPMAPVLRLAMFEEDGGQWVFRRICKRWRIADARCRGGRAVRYARRSLSHPRREVSAVRGVSEWIPQDVMLDLVSYLAAQGYRVEHVPDAADECPPPVDGIRAAKRSRAAR